MLRLAAILVICIFSLPANAWWEKEHKVVAIIAENNLSEHAKQQVRQLLDGNSLASVASWADSVKSNPKWSHTKRWHYVNFAENDSPSKHIPVPAGDILWALNYVYQDLQRPSATKQSKRDSLMFFVHFVADIHQPLHAGKFSDAGGNRVAINWFNSSRKQNLHKVWDGLLTATKMNAEDYAKKIDKASISQRIQWQNSSFADWAEESVDLRPQVYDFGGAKNDKTVKLGRWYSKKNKAVAEKRLQQAGVRLAFHLNQLFAK
jgi:hypothetical protein